MLLAALRCGWIGAWLLRRAGAGLWVATLAVWPGGPCSGAVAAGAPPLQTMLRAIVPLRAEVPEEARSARYLGTRRQGTGLVIDAKGLVLTIGYLILEAHSVEILVDREVVPADVVAYDFASGFGLVRARAPVPVPPLRLGSSQELAERDPVMVASFGGEGGLQPAIVVSRRDFAGYWEYILEDAIFTSPPHPNFSGAALLSLGGALLGVGYLIVSDALPRASPVPGNMFIPIDRLKPIIGDLLLAGRSAEPPRPWLGLYAQEYASRVVVIRVIEDGPASRAGVAVGDVILGVGDTPVVSLMELYRSIWSYGAPGADVPLVVMRGGKLERVVVASGDRYAWIAPSRH